MDFEKACYSMSALETAADMVKSIKWSARRKDEHFAKWNEVEKVYSYARDHINRFLFNPDIELRNYRNAAYYHKNYTKAELDSMLNMAHRHICNELNDILKMIRCGEVDSCD